MPTSNSNSNTSSITILHILSQRPVRTGSGVTLEAIVRGAAKRGYQQHVIVGTDITDATPQIGDLPASHIHPLVFNDPSTALNFPLPGMSDVMPYTSTVFSTMTQDQLQVYQAAWKRHIEAVIALTKPTLIHSHHIWIMSSMLKDIVDTNIPIVTHCHATGLRQLELCGQNHGNIVRAVKNGCARNDHFVVLHKGHEELLKEKLKIGGDKITVVGAGFNEAVFHSNGRSTTTSTISGDTTNINLLYAGKYSHSKGLPWLLDAVERIIKKRHENHTTVTLHIAGTGAGPEADQLRIRMQAMPNVVVHGQVDQVTLANLMRQAHVFVLPSFYEGLPLVLVEAAACGCRLVATNLVGVTQELVEPLKGVLEVVELPRLKTIDQPRKEDLPAFVDRLTVALEVAINKPTIINNNTAKGGVPSQVAPFTWTAVYERIETVWQHVLENKELY